MTGTQRRLDILAAEDDPDDRLLIDEAMGEVGGGHRIDFVADGEALLARLREGRPPDLVLLDLNMPRMNGLEALARMKGDVTLRSLPVVVFTTSNAAEDVEQSYAAGAGGFVSKPESFADLVAALQRITDYWSTAVSLPRRGPGRTFRPGP